MENYNKNTMIPLNPSECKKLVQTPHIEVPQELKNIRKMLKNYFKDDTYDLEDIIIHLNKIYDQYYQRRDSDFEL